MATLDRPAAVPMWERAISFAGPALAMAIAAAGLAVGAIATFTVDGPPVARILLAGVSALPIAAAALARQGQENGQQRRWTEALGAAALAAFLPLVVGSGAIFASAGL